MTKIDYPDDCKIIQRVLLENGWEATLSECQNIWQERSNTWCAGWLFLPENPDRIIEDINDYTKYSIV